MRLSTELLGPYSRGPGLTKIGEDLEHAAVVTFEGTGEIAVVEDDGLARPDLNDSYPSVWHYLLFVAETSRPL
jgi:hypothetical protein